MSKNKSGKPAAPPAAAASPAEAAPAPAEVGANGTGNGNGRARGPVEEVIAKRARQLAKKIQRFKDYSAKPLESLNADQKIAVQSLPALEGALNELQELIKPGGVVENAELVEAGRLRDLQKEANSQRSAAGTSSITEFQEKLTPRLALFIRLHALLHPARPSDHQHLTFGHLDLPSHLHEEVQATDVLRAGRMWDDLTRGGPEAKVVVQGLVDGPKGEDEENDHIHHLLDLLSQPPAETSFPPTHPSSPTRDDTLDLQTSADGEYPAEHPTEVIQPGSVNASRRDSVVEQANGGGGGGFLNFLQEDELHGSPATARQEPLGDDDYEVVPMLEPHQPPFEETPAEPEPAPTPAPMQSGNTSFNWADDHDEEHQSPAAPIEQPAASTPAAVSAPASAPKEAVPSKTDAAPASAAAAPAGPSKSPANGPGTSPVRAQGQRPARGGRGGAQTAAPAQTPKRPTTVVDEDGFEMKVRTRPPVPTRGSGRGRGGGQGGERGRGGAAGGGGGGSGRGRAPGGPSRGGPRNGPSGQANGGHANGDAPRANGHAQGQTPHRPSHTSQNSHGGQKPKSAGAGTKQAPPPAAPAPAPTAA